MPQLNTHTCLLFFSLVYSEILTIDLNNKRVCINVKCKMLDLLLLYLSSYCQSVKKY